MPDPAPMFWFDHEWPAAEAGRAMGPVSAVAEDPVDGTLYLLGRGQVMDPLIAIAPDGRRLRSVRTWADGLFNYPHGLRIDRDRNLWATDVGTNEVHKISRDGTLLLSLGTRGEAGGGPDHFDAPTDVAFAADGSVLVADGHRRSARIVRFGADGRFAATWGEPGSGRDQLDLPHSLVVGNDGRLYVCDRHNFRLHVFDEVGTTEAIWTNVGEPHWISIGPGGETWLVTSHTLRDLATAAERHPIRNLSYSASLSRLLRYDLRTGTILGGLEAPPATGGHSVTMTRNGGLIISSLTRGVLTWQPGMHPAFEGEWGEVREKADVVVNYIPGAGTTTGSGADGAAGPDAGDA